MADAQPGKRLRTLCYDTKLPSTMDERPKQKKGETINSATFTTPDVMTSYHVPHVCTEEWLKSAPCQLELLLGKGYAQGDRKLAKVPSRRRARRAPDETTPGMGLSFLLAGLLRIREHYRLHLQPRRIQVVAPRDSISGNYPETRFRADTPRALTEPMCERSTGNVSV